MSIAWTTVEDALHAWIVAGSGLTADQVLWARQNARRPTGTFVALSVLSVRPIGQDWLRVKDNLLELDDDEVESVDADEDTFTLTAHQYVNGDGPVRLTTDGTLPAPLAADTDYFVIVSDEDTIQLAETAQAAVAGDPIDLTNEGAGAHTIVDTAETWRAGQEITHTAEGVREALIQMQCFAGDPTGVSMPQAILERVVASARLPSRRSALSSAGVGISRFGTVLPIDGVIGSSLFEPRAVLEMRAFLSSDVAEFGSFIESAEVTNDDTDETFTVERD